MKKIFSSTKFNNITKHMEIYSIHGENDLLIGTVIHDDVLRDAVLTAIREAEKTAYKSALIDARAAINMIRIS